MTDLQQVLARLDALESKEAVEQLMVAYMAATDRESEKGEPVGTINAEQLECVLEGTAHDRLERLGLEA